MLVQMLGCSTTICFDLLMYYHYQFSCHLCQLFSFHGNLLIIVAIPDLCVRTCSRPLSAKKNRHSYFLNSIVNITEYMIGLVVYVNWPIFLSLIINCQFFYFRRNIQ